MDSRVYFLGFRSDVKNLLKTSDVFLLTSLQEGLTHYIMEVAASRLLIDEGKGSGNTLQLSSQAAD